MTGKPTERPDGKMRATITNPIFVILPVLLSWLVADATPAAAQAAIQYMTVTQSNGESYSETRGFTDLADCQRLMARNLAEAQQLGYLTSSTGGDPLASIS